MDPGRMIFLCLVLCVCLEVVFGTNQFYQIADTKELCTENVADPLSFFERFQTATKVSHFCLKTLFSAKNNHNLADAVSKGCAADKQNLCDAIYHLFRKFPFQATQVPNSLQFMKSRSNFDIYIHDLLVSKQFSFGRLPAGYDISVIVPPNVYVPKNNIFDGIKMQRFQQIDKSCFDLLNPNHFPNPASYTRYLTLGATNPTLKSLETALILACQAQNVEIVDKLLKRRISPDAGNGAALRISASLNPKILDMLFAMKPNYRMLGDSAFISAIDAGLVENINYFYYKIQSRKFDFEELNHIFAFDRNLRHFQLFINSVKSFDGVNIILEKLCGSSLVALGEFPAAVFLKPNQVQLCYKSALRYLNIGTIKFLMLYHPSFFLNHDDPQLRAAIDSPGENFNNLAHALAELNGRTEFDVQLELLILFGDFEKIDIFLKSLSQPWLVEYRKSKIDFIRILTFASRDIRKMNLILKTFSPSLSEEKMILLSGTCDISIIRKYFKFYGVIDQLKFAIISHCHNIFHEILAANEAEVDLKLLVETAVSHKSIVTLDHIQYQVGRSAFVSSVSALKNLNMISGYIAEYLILSGIHRTVFLNTGWVVSKYASIKDTSEKKNASSTKRVVSEDVDQKDVSKLRKISPTDTAKETATKVVVYIFEFGMDARDGLKNPIIQENYTSRPDLVFHGNAVSDVILSHFEGPTENIDFVPVVAGNSSSEEIRAVGNIVKDFLDRKKAYSNYVGFVNLSFGGCFDFKLNMAIQTLYEAGVIGVAAAGNSSSDSCRESPSSSPYVITVGGNIWENGKTLIDPTSSFGSCVDVFASTEYSYKQNNRRGTSYAAPRITRILAEAALKGLIQTFDDAKKYIQNAISDPSLIFPYNDPSTPTFVLKESFYAKERVVNIVQNAPAAPTQHEQKEATTSQHPMRVSADGSSEGADTQKIDQKSSTVKVIVQPEIEGVSHIEKNTIS